MTRNEMVAMLDEAVERFFDLRDNPSEYQASLKEQIEFTEKLYEFIAGSDGAPDENVLDEVLMNSESEIHGWLLDLPLHLANYGMVDEALEQVRDNLNRFPEDVWIIIKSGDVFEALKENEKALELYHRAYDMTETRTYSRDGVLERLVPLLRNIDRNEEADALIEKEKIKPVLPAKTEKVGRNEPCPCGSGKKFKKCCGK